MTPRPDNVVLITVIGILIAQRILVCKAQSDANTNQDGKDSSPEFPDAVYDPAFSEIRAAINSRLSANQNAANSPQELVNSVQDDLKQNSRLASLQGYVSNVLSFTAKLNRDQFMAIYVNNNLSSMSNDTLLAVPNEAIYLLPSRLLATLNLPQIWLLLHSNQSGISLSGRLLRSIEHESAAPLLAGRMFSFFNVSGLPVAVKLDMALFISRLWSTPAVWEKNLIQALRDASGDLLFYLPSNFTLNLPVETAQTLLVAMSSVRNISSVQLRYRCPLAWRSGLDLSSWSSDDFANYGRWMVCFEAANITTGLLTNAQVPVQGFQIFGTNAALLSELNRVQAIALLGAFFSTRGFINDTDIAELMDLSRFIVPPIVDPNFINAGDFVEAFNAITTGIVNHYDTPVQMEMAWLNFVLTQSTVREPKDISKESLRNIGRLFYLLPVADVRQISPAVIVDRFSNLLSTVSSNRLSLPTMRYLVGLIAVQRTWGRRNEWDGTELDAVPDELIPGLTSDIMLSMPQNRIATSFMRKLLKNARHMLISQRAIIRASSPMNTLTVLLQLDGPISILPLVNVRTAMEAKIDESILGLAQDDDRRYGLIEALPRPILMATLSKRRPASKWTYGALAGELGSVILGLSCSDISHLELVDIFNVIQYYRAALDNVTVLTNNSTAAIPDDVRYCFNRKLRIWLTSIYPNTTGSVKTLNMTRGTMGMLGVGDVRALGGQILAEFRSDELRLLSDSVVVAAYAEIGLIPSALLLTYHPFQRISEIATNASKLLMANSNRLVYSDMMVLGSLLYYASRDQIDAMENNALRRFIFVSGADKKMACVRGEQRNNWAQKLKFIFGAPATWDSQTVYSLSGLLVMFGRSDLNTVNATSFQQVADQLLRAISLPEWPGRQGSSFLQGCVDILGAEGPAYRDSYYDVMRTVQQAVLSGPKLAIFGKGGSSLTCPMVRVMGDSAAVLTIDSLKAMSAKGIEDCADVFGNLEFENADAYKYIYATIQTAHSISSDDIVAFGKISLGMQSTDVSKLAQPLSADAWASVGKLQLPRELRAALATKFINDTLAKISSNGSQQMAPEQQNQLLSTASISTVSLISLQNVLCGFSRDQIKAIFGNKPALLRQISVVFGGLSNTCPLDSLQTLAEVAISSPEDFGDTAGWTEEDVRSLGVVIAGLSTDALRRLKAEPLLGLTPAISPLITSDFMKTLNPAQLSNLPRLVVLMLSDSALSGLKQDQLTALRAGDAGTLVTSFRGDDKFVKNENDFEGSSGSAIFYQMIVIVISTSLHWFRIDLIL